MAEEKAKSVYGLSFGELQDFLSGMGEPGFRASQIWEWLYVRGVSSFGEMKNLPLSLRNSLSGFFDAAPLSCVAVSEGADGVKKFLLECPDKERIESVAIPSGGKYTLCLSTQVGCALGCLFCATGNSGFVRNLDSGEIVQQYLAARKALDGRISNIVFMGMGEPLANYGNLLGAIRIFNDGRGISIGARKITVSTCGIVPGIMRLAEEGLQVELSVSLHAASDELRSKIMPVNKTWPLDALIAAARAYTEKTGRIITFEYTLVKGLNDTREDAKRLLETVRSAGGRVNLIPLSPVDHYDGTAPDENVQELFMRILRRGGVNATLRRSKGSSVSAACGQLRLRKSGSDREE